MEIINKYSTPILFMVFNRPDLTMKVFEEIKKLKPAKLYISADGPRENKEGEQEKCIETRKIAKFVDWDCDLKILFREKNLGCKMAVSTAIDWFFENEEEGIILEDDSLPNQSFFFFCNELLIKYRDVEKIMEIGGNNFQPDVKYEGSYFFSRYSNMPGWATWRRAWKKYDVTIRDFPNFLKEKRIKKILGSNPVQYYWLYKFWKVYKNKVDTWDYQWTYTCWNNDGITIFPTKNFISNIGYNNADAAHTTMDNKQLAEIKREEMSEIVHPNSIQINFLADKRAEKIHPNVTYFKKIISWGFITCVRLNLIK
jgi:hypothetical protein